MSTDGIEIVSAIAKIIDDKKGMNLLILDLRDSSSMANFFVIAQGSVDRHLISIAHGILKGMKVQGIECIGEEGIQSGEWVALDFSDVIVHLFSSGVREKYSLERIWPESKIVDRTAFCLENQTT